MTGADLREHAERARDVRYLLGPLTRKVGNRLVVEQCAIAGALTPTVLGDAARAAAAEYVVRRLDQYSDPLERGWQAVYHAADPTEGRPPA